MYRDYAPKGVRFYYIYKALAHPELDGYITPFTLEERLMHVAEAQHKLGSEVTWPCDTMANEAKHALGDAPNSEFIFDPEGRLVVRRRWSDPAALRQDLARLVGPAESRTQVSDLNLPSPPPPERAPTGVVPRLEVPWGMIPLKSEPIPDEKETPFYAKLRVEAERSLLQEGKGKLYLGFFSTRCTRSIGTTRSRPCALTWMPPTRSPQNRATVRVLKWPPSRMPIPANFSST